MFLQMAVIQKVLNSNQLTTSSTEKNSEIAVVFWTQVNEMMATKLSQAAQSNVQ